MFTNKTRPGKTFNIANREMMKMPTKVIRFKETKSKPMHAEKKDVPAVK